MTSISNKTIWNIAYPIIFGNLAQTLIALTDTAFLGRVSVEDYPEIGKTEYGVGSYLQGAGTDGPV